MQTNTDMTNIFYLYLYDKVVSRRSFFDNYSQMY